MKTNYTSLNDIKIAIQNAIKENSLFKLPAILIIILVKYMLPYITANFLNIFTRKDKNEKQTIGFSNLYYNGNPRAVFEYMLKNKDKYEIFWVAGSKQTVKDVKRAGGKAFLINGILGVPYFLKTDLWIVAHKGYDIPPLPHKSYKTIQLWHGIGPKGISHSEKDYENYDIWCLASKYSKQRHIELWNAPPEKLYETGLARMDRLYNYLKMPKEKLLDEIKIKKGKKVILYAPTYDIGLWPWGDAFVEFENVCNFCKENDLILILRLHPYAKINKKRLKELILKYDNIYWLDMSEEADTMKLLAISDILITDWSSIYTDYFLTKRPIIYFEIDKDYYTNTRGKPEIPPDFRAGEITYNNEDFFNALKIVLEKGNRFKKEQEKLLKIIHGDIDGKASERIIKIIDDVIKTS